MTRHSKQHKEVVHRAEVNGFNSFYDNNWGTLKVREGADAKGDFDSCVLCVHQAKDPLLCPKGHIYCKACIYEFMLKQKAHKREQQEAFEQQQAKLAGEKQQEQADEEERKLEDFKRGEISVTTGLGKRKHGGNLTGYETYKTDKGEVYLVDKEIVKKHAVGTALLNDEEKQKRAKILPCFWIPNLTPASKEATLAAPNPHLVDPFGNIIKRKQLKAVKFTLTPEGKKNPKLRKGAFMCPLSKKTLANGHKLFFIAPTGDVVISESMKLIKAEGHYNGQKVKAKHIIEFANNGSGFAAAGAKTVEARHRPAFAV